MEEGIARKYYSREDIQKALLSFAKEKEVAPRFDVYFGKRPDTLENLFDIKALVKKGVTSFHLSEERWLNPMLLGPQFSKEDMSIDLTYIEKAMRDISELVDPFRQTIIIKSTVIPGTCRRFA